MTDARCSAGQTVPQPDGNVTALENRWIQQYGGDEVNLLATQISTLTVAKMAQFPNRPGFGTNGTKVVLWANYFKMDIKTPPLYKYDVVVTEAKLPESSSEASEATGKPAAPAEGPKGRKLAQMIMMALRVLDIPDYTIATEYKDKVISLQKLDLPEDAVITVKYTDSRKRQHDWNVKFHGPQPIPVDLLLEYLNSMSDPQDDRSFPKFPEVVDAFNIVLGHSPRIDKNTVSVGRGRYFAIDEGRIDETKKMAPGLLTILRGYFQSVRLATGRLLLNANVTHGIFRRPSHLVDLFRQLKLARMDVPSTAGLTAYFATLRRLQRYLNKARIECKISAENSDQPGKFILSERTIAGLATDKDGNDKDRGNPRPQFQPGFQFAGPGNVKFFLRQPKTPPGAPVPPPPKGCAWNSFVKVSDFYLGKYGIRADLSLPLINVGSSSKPVYVLAELCQLLPQPIKAKLDPDQQDAMIQFACRPPPSNADSITSAGRQILQLDNNMFLSTFGIAVGKQLITVNGRELKPPKIAYLNKNNSPAPVMPSDGGWLMKGVKVYKGGTFIRTWTFLYIDGYDGRDHYEIAKRTVVQFAGFMAETGININRNPQPANGVRIAGNQDKELAAAFKELAELPVKPQLVIVVLPDKSAPPYNMIKKLGDVDHGIQTVCVVRGKLLQEKGQLGYFANVGLKVNLKFGGMNHKLNDDMGIVSSGKTMVAGYDVTHPTNLGPGMGEHAPSIVGLVASVDRDLASWPAVAWNNDAGQEELGPELVVKFQSRLTLWQNMNRGGLPDNIILFRDGVSEGQFKMVLEREVAYIRRACDLTYGGLKKPRLTVIVSVKRHQTRFYPTDPSHIHPRSKSPKEGTVVDRGVTNVRYWDFFLQAHASLQGMLPDLALLCLFFNVFSFA